MTLCLRHGAKVERRNCEGETALSDAVSWASVEAVRLSARWRSEFSKPESNRLATEMLRDLSEQRMSLPRIWVRA